jgi:hypothetical protein
MPETNIPTLAMSTDVKLSVDWKQLGLKMTEVLAQGFLTAFGGDGISGGITALVDAMGTIKADDDPSQKAWSLTMLCFGWALDELTATAASKDDHVGKEVNSLIREAKKRIAASEGDIPVTFLHRPTTLPLYQALRDEYISRKNIFRRGVHETDEVLRARFDSAFNRAMFEVLARKGDTFQSVITALTSPGVVAAEGEANWNAYRKRLSYDFEVRPIFGQEQSRISLSQLYVPLRGYWRNKETVPEDALNYLVAAHEIGMMDATLDAWLDHGSDADNIRLIGGGPGSGKSTTLRALAQRCADRADWRPLFIPLQHIGLEGDLRDAVNRFFTDRTNGAFTQPPLSRESVEDGPPILLIFDGLDELARPGEAANEVVNLFATRLANLLSSLKGDSPKSVKAVVSGRMPSFQAAKRYITPPRQGCLEVYGFAPAGTDSDVPELWRLDQRGIWWKQYASLTGLSASLPPAFSSEDLRGITHEPLLCYLLVLSGFATGAWESAAENHNRIYKTLVDSIWQRGWGDGPEKRQGAGRALTKSDFNTLMQTIALAAWLGGDTRVASERRFQEAVKITNSEEAWAVFKEANGPDVTNLAMNFYLKASEGTQRGFEFTHKSFGDYLAARAILEFAEGLPPLINRKVDHAMTDWLEATGTGRLSGEILTFLRDEVRLQTTDGDEPNQIDNVASLKIAFEKFLSTILAEGLPAQSGTMTWRSAEAQQRNSETMAWAVMNSLSLTLERWGREDRFVRVTWPDPKRSFARLLTRLTEDTDRFRSPELQCFSNIVAPEASLFGMAISYIDLRGSEMPKANFAGCHLIGAKLSNGNFEEATFERAMLDSAEVQGANFSRANLIDTRVERVRVDQAKFDDAIVSDLTLVHVDMELARDILPKWRYRRMRYYSSSPHDYLIEAPRIRDLVAKLRSADDDNEDNTSEK